MNLWCDKGEVDQAKEEMNKIRENKPIQRRHSW